MCIQLICRYSCGHQTAECAPCSKKKFGGCRGVKPVSEPYGDRMCPTCCKLGLTAPHTQSLVSSRLTRGLSSEASIRSSQRRFRKPTKYPIARGALLGANGRTIRGKCISDDKSNRNAESDAGGDLETPTLDRFGSSRYSAVLM